MASGSCRRAPHTEGGGGGAPAAAFRGFAAAPASSTSAKEVGGLKYWKPTSPGQRGRVTISRVGLHKGGPLKALTTRVKSSGGRNHQGRTTVWHRGGGARRLYRMVDFKRAPTGEAGVVERLEYDPNRTARIALVQYPTAGPAYIIAPRGLKPGDSVESGPDAAIKVGNALPLASIPMGTVLHNVELMPGRGGQIARSAGSSVTLVGKGADGKHAQLRMQSGEMRLVPMQCNATIGVVGTEQHMNQKLGKAGATRHRGRRPVVRGVAMNPVDHPHGGGEAKSSGGRPSVTPWGKPTKGARTRSNPLTQKYIISRRPPTKK